MSTALPKRALLAFTASTIESGVSLRWASNTPRSSHAFFKQAHRACHPLGPWNRSMSEPRLGSKLLQDGLQG